MIHQVNDSHIAAQEAAGLPFLQGIEATIRALNGLWFHAARRRRELPTPPPEPVSDLSPATLDATLARYAISLPKSEAVASAADAGQAAERIGFPVALKIRSRDILHKTEAGRQRTAPRSKPRRSRSAGSFSTIARASATSRSTR